MSQQTPRTEAMIDSCGDYEKAYHYNGRFADFARSLELECARLAHEKAELAKLVERAVNMLWLAIPETREPVHSASHNPITAWVADARAALAKESVK